MHMNIAPSFLSNIKFDRNICDITIMEPHFSCKTLKRSKYDAVAQKINMKQTLHKAGSYQKLIKYSF